jgi:FtsZ-interacting cell division protein ZipA
MSQLRWSLLILGAVFIAALGWWEWRRPRQARAAGPGARAAPREPAAEVSAQRAARESPLQLPEIHARASLASGDLPVLELERDPEELPVLSAADEKFAERAEPSAREDEIPLGEIPLPRSDDPPIGELPDVELEEGGAAGHDAGQDAGSETAAAQDTPRQASDLETAAPPEDAPEDAPAPMRDAGPPAGARELPRERLPELPAAPAPLVDWPPDAERRVLSLRLVAALPERFAGRSVRQALAAEGFVLGKFAIFHKPDEERRAVLSAASLTRPGTFDVQTMDSQHYGGLSLFAVLPGPRSTPETFEELVATAHSLNHRLQGMLQDEAGSPLTPARIASLREHLGRETSS